jgi:hypothetical protein
MEGSEVVESNGDKSATIAYHPWLVCARCERHTKHTYDRHQRFVVTEKKMAFDDGRKKYIFKLDPGSDKAESRPVYVCVECETRRIWGFEEK